MTSFFTRKLRMAVLSLGMAGAVALLVPVSAAPATASPDNGQHAYLALGDSVVFGYITQAGYEYGNPDNFLGYPGRVGEAFNLNTTNAACPGEATTSFLSATGADNGCRPYRQLFPLHASHTGTQFAFAKSFLAAHRYAKLVTIMLGANDGFLLEQSCATAPNPIQCIEAGIPALLKLVGTNIDTTLKALRPEFSGVLMVVNYYSIDYTDPLQTLFTTLLDQTLGATAKADGAAVADVFTAFQTAAAAAGGKTCNAGLLNASPSNQLLCDVHPSQSGAQLIAKTVEAAYLAATAH